MIRFFLFLLFSLPILAAPPKTPQAIATEILAPLLDPAKIETLKGDRPVNTRLYRLLHWLETARKGGGDLSGIMNAAQAAAGYGGTPRAKADKQAILWTRAKLERWGCFSPEGMAKLRKGGSPPITKGEHAGNAIALDHLLPVSVAPEVAARFFNPEAITADENRRKGAKITEREIALARLWNREGLLSGEGLQAVESAAGG